MRLRAHRGCVVARRDTKVVQTMASLPLHLGESVFADVDRRLADSDAELEARYPGDSGARQPVHTVYVPADRFHAGTVAEWGRQAQDLITAYLPDPGSLAAITGMSPALAAEVLPLVVAKVAREPVEDLRIDFEDGYGPHTDSEEDAAAVAAAGELVSALAAGSAPPFVGLRFKSLEARTRRRGLRTLDLFLGVLCDGSALPDGLRITLPKVTSVAQVEAFAAICARLEDALGLPGGSVGFEIQVETPQAILSASGHAAVAPMLHAGEGRVTGLHYGTYDYSAACGISAAQQSMDHPAADHAKAVMQVAAAGTGVQLSDGSTNVLPVGGQDEVAAAWALHAGLVRRSLERGFYQGWDLHPGQLVTRYAATYAFYREGMQAATERLRAYLGQVGGAVLDEPATAQAMASLLVRGLHSGALTEAEVVARTGASRAELDGLYRRRVG